jgi:hypothetical protein
MLWPCLVMREDDRLRGMPRDEEWLLDQGFRVVVEKDEDGLYWASPVHRDNLSDNVPKYGRGDSAEASVRRARQRHEGEQLGMDSGGKPS